MDELNVPSSHFASEDICTEKQDKHTKYEYHFCSVQRSFVSVHVVVA